MSIDIIKLSPDSFSTIFLRKEDRVILRTEAGRRIVINREFPDEWTPYRVYEYEQALNDNKRNIQLIDRSYLAQIEKELEDKLR
jgi:hypothetical protein